MKKLFIIIGILIMAAIGHSEVLLQWDAPEEEVETWLYLVPVGGEVDLDTPAVKAMPGVNEAAIPAPAPGDYEAAAIHYNGKKSPLSERILIIVPLEPPEPVKNLRKAIKTEVLSPTRAWSVSLSDQDSPISNALDGSTDTLWHTYYLNGEVNHPHIIFFDLGEVKEITGFEYYTRQDGSANGDIKDFELYILNETDEEKAPLITGTFNKGKNELNFYAVQGRYIKLVALSEVKGNAWASAAEFKILGQ